MTKGAKMVKMAKMVTHQAKDAQRRQKVTKTKRGQKRGKKAGRRAISQ